MAAPAPQQARNPYADNIAIRNLWVVGGGPTRPDIAPALDMWQQLNPNVPASIVPGTVITCPLRNVGLIKRLWIKITCTVTAGASSTSTLTKFGAANLLSNVIYTDLGNNQRINTTGWHLFALSSVKKRRPFGAAMTNDNPCGFGNNYSVITAPSSLAATVGGTVRMYFEVPFAYDDHDLRGAVYSDVTQQQQQIQFTFNPNMFAASTDDGTLAMYKSAGSDKATLSAVSIQIYQNYLDQGPRDGKGFPILPFLDIATGYMLNNTSSPLPVVNQDLNTPFTNGRQFQSVMFYYDNNGTLNAGTDINYIEVQSANLTQITFFDPITQALRGRNVLGDDMPQGMYYLPFRDRPIDTNVYGNMQLTTNASNVGGSGAFNGFGWESLALIGQVQQAGSIPSGGGA